MYIIFEEINQKLTAHSPANQFLNRVSIMS